MAFQVLLQLQAILYKNILNHLGNKKKLFCQFFFPIFISFIFVLTQIYKQQNPIIGIILTILLKMYIGMIGLSAIRQLVTLFLTQREDKHRQYQMIFGLSERCHTLSNLFYMGLYMSVFLLPFYLTLNYYEFKIEYVLIFGSFVISSLSLTLMLTSFFADHKIASQIIGMIFSMSAFLPLLYSGQQAHSVVDYLGMFMPNSSFSIAITSNSITSSLYSLSMTKVYLFIYSCVQFPSFYKKCFKSICKNKKLKSFFSNSQQRKNGTNALTQDFQLNQQLSVPSFSSSSAETQTQHNREPISQEECPYIVKIKDLIKTYKIKEGEFNALNKISMTINKKQIYGLLGRNGAGKTTLVDILTEVSEQTSGTVKINFSQNKNKKIGICYQHQILYEQMTMIQHLRFYSKIKNISQSSLQGENEQIDFLVSMLGIQDECNKKVKQLSGGNKRKLSVAIAILGKPELLIFDEPTSGLDPLSRRNIWEIFSQLRQKFQSSIILTTHHLDQAQYLSDYISVIQKGTIIVQNTPEQIKQKYGNGYYLTLQVVQNQSQPHVNSKKIQSIKTSLSQMENIEKVQEVQREENIVKLFIKFRSFEKEKPDTNYNNINSRLIMRMRKQQEQENQYEKKDQDQLLVKSNHRNHHNELLNMIQWLQSQQNLKIQVEANSLQQSFIAIIKDPQNTKSSNSNQSIDLTNRTQRLQQQPVNEDSFAYVIKKIANQTFGMFLRCVYFHKGQSLKFVIMYNINILIFMISMFFNKFIKHALQAKQDQNEFSEALNQINKQSSSKDSQTYQNSMLILQGYVIMTGAFIAVSIYERQKKIKMVFNTRGLNPFAYWFGSFIFDYTCFLINLAIMVNLISPQSFQFLPSLQPFIFLGIGMILFAYTASHLFQKITTANTWFSLINILFGFMILPIVMIAKGTFLQNLKIIKYFYPFYDLNMLIMSQNKQLNQMTSMSMPGKQANGTPQEQAHYIYIAILFYIFMLISIQIGLVKRLKLLIINENLDNSVTSVQNVKLQNVCKNYGQLQALKNVSYYVQNQRVALLGHNGAGKSTTFGLISSQINPSSGTIYLQSKLNMPYNRRLNSVGICYQDDALWQNLTPLEIMNIFAYVVPHQHSGKQIVWLFENLQFQSQNYNKRFQNLSGGNKRKVCMAVSLYGDPNIRLLDQCSTGLDPSSRFAMVQTIKQSIYGSTIFTTHSMGQAQTLCSKAIIMKKGQVMQFDSIYKLKQKYYNCFWIDLQLSAQKSLFRQSSISPQLQLQKSIKFITDDERLKKKIRIFSQKENRVRIQLKKQQWKLSQILRIIIQKWIKQNFVLDFSIYQPKLEDVYINLTRESPLSNNFLQNQREMQIQLQTYSQN